jgi:hypothetical protein
MASASPLRPKDFIIGKFCPLSDQSGRIRACWQRAIRLILTHCRLSFHSLMPMELLGSNVLRID